MLGGQLEISLLDPGSLWSCTEVCHAGTASVLGYRPSQSCPNATAKLTELKEVQALQGCAVQRTPR